MLVICVLAGLDYLRRDIGSKSKIYLLRDRVVLYKIFNNSEWRVLVFNTYYSLQLSFRMSKYLTVCVLLSFSTIYVIYIDATK